MAVYVSNINIPVGEDFSQTFTLENVFSNTPIDLNNYTGRSYLKKHPLSLNTTAVFEVSFPNREAGEIRISLSSTITSYIKPGRYSYDILVNNNNTQKRVIEGSAIVTAGVTT